MKFIIKNIRYIVATILSIPLITIYFLSMIIPIKFENSFVENPRVVAVASFYTTLVMLIVREFVTSIRIRDALTVLIIFVVSFYSYVAGLYFELNYLALQKHIIIPPSFIYIPCSDASRCDNFAALSISIPLTIGFILLIYGALGFSKNRTSSQSTDISKNL
ncbi:MAG: hypothetical protein QXT53_02940 [Ignisphaera sp.]